MALVAVCSNCRHAYKIWRKKVEEIEKGATAPFFYIFFYTWKNHFAAKPATLLIRRKHLYFYVNQFRFGKVGFL
jgi:hypothetical protein